MMKNRTYREALLGASSLLEAANINPKISEWLMLHLLQLDRTGWMQQLNKEIPLAECNTYSQWINRVVSGEPYQYITGVEEFYGREFIVSPDVLIPRPETEQLVENVLQYRNERWSEAEKVVAVDIGTGSGAIAISLALESKLMEVLAVDLSLAALDIARRNALKLHANVQFLQSDLLSSLIQTEQQVDIIVSNPPYIPLHQKELLDHNVVDFEPHLALFAEEDGLYFYRKITEQAKKILKSKGMIAFEVGFDQAEQVATIIKEHFPQAQCEIKRDLQGIDRMVFGLL
jgi:release factor glutamine methyltransferase